MNPKADITLPGTWQVEQTITFPGQSGGGGHRSDWLLLATESGADSGGPRTIKWWLAPLDAAARAYTERRERPLSWTADKVGWEGQPCVPWVTLTWVDTFDHAAQQAGTPLEKCCGRISRTA